MMRTLLVIAVCSCAALGCGARGPAAPSPRTPASAGAGGAGAGAADASHTPDGDARAEQPEQSDRTPDDPAPEDSELETIDLEPVRIQVVGRDAKGNPELEAFDARSLLDKGNEALADGRNDDAIAHYEQLRAMFPDSQLAPSAIYNTGLAREAAGDYDAAIRDYTALARKPALGRDSLDAHLRIGAVQAELERWPQARQTLEEIKRRRDLTYADRIEVMARLGYIALEQDDFTTAEQILTEAIAYYRELTTPLDNNYFIAMAHYYLAQIPHRQFLAIPMRLPDEQLRKDLESKSDLVVQAYDRYLRVLDLQHVYWATAAGYQMSQVYKELWDDIVRAPIPPQLTPEAAEIYVAEVHKSVLTFLEKAMNGHTKNVELAAAYRASTVWSEASRKRVTEISQILARESSGEIVVPAARSTHGLDATPGETVAGEYVPARVEL